MAEFTLDEIARAREQLEKHPDSVASGDTLKALLDAAERGLTNDRKAKAFDALAAMYRKSDIQIEAFGKNNEEVDVWASGETGRAPSLLEAVEALALKLAKGGA